MVKVLFVCMGNICRSPTAQGVFETLVQREGLAPRIEIDSAGTHAYHIGEPPDKRAQEAAKRRGVDLSTQRARKVRAEDFLEYDYVLAMDRSNYEDLRTICHPDYEERLRLFLEFAPQSGEQDVPDPYYGGAQGFERVLDLIEAASAGLLAEMRARHGL
ncbi:MAG: low molecular weight phosphotyrosine protein phosphatase [Gammaproteobacteria bacterium]|nr:low molecular weight phosphotyrosine protein phosphatase [Gammaproteobacteria bacterium]